jgi:integrase
MSHYNEKEVLFDDGSVIIFRRGDAWSEGNKRIWQARLKIKGWKGYKFVSLKTTNKELAKQAAHQEWARLSQMAATGQSLSSNYTFESAWAKFSDEMMESWSADRQRWHTNIFNRYFKAYFGEKKLDEITDDFARGYWPWRRKYWNADGAKQIAYNRRRKRAKSYNSFNASKNPALKTLKMEQSALNQFFNWCFSTKRIIKFPIQMKVDRGKDENVGRRPSFDSDEWRVLARNLQSWAACKGKYADSKANQFHRHYRQQLRYYALFLANTGIRSGTETRFMKWEDIKEIEIDRGVGQQETILDIRIRTTGKTRRNRHVMSQSNCVRWMQEWRKISHYSGTQDFVWYGMSGKGEPQKVATDQNKTFQSFLKSVKYRDHKGGLLCDSEGNRRSLYSLRHFYAEQRIINGLSYEFLSKNMGTGIEQLVKHYEQTTTKQHAAEITKTKFAKKKAVDVGKMVEDLTEQQRNELFKKLAKDHFKPLPKANL